LRPSAAPGLPAHAPRKYIEKSGKAGGAHGSCWSGRGLASAPARDADFSDGEAAEEAASGRAWRFVMLVCPVSKKEGKAKALMVGAGCRRDVAMRVSPPRHLRDSGAAQCVQPGGPPAALFQKPSRRSSL